MRFFSDSFIATDPSLGAPSNVQIKVPVITLKNCVLLIKKFCFRPHVCISLQENEHNTDRPDPTDLQSKVSHHGLVCVSVSKWDQFKWV